MLSIGMIVKNEIRCIERCLKALQPLRECIPCELVIADTGSTDGTREIVQQYADICFDFEWIGDFSAARNAVLDRCSGKWTLTVDADEYLDPNFSQLTEFLTDKRNKRYRWGAVNIISYPDFEMKGEETDFLALRLARMDMKPRYSGIIHEAFPDVRADQCMPLIDVRFHHDGYAKDSGHIVKKLERNLRLLQRALEKSPDDLRLLVQAVESSGHLPAQKIEYLRRAMKVLESQISTSIGKQLGPVLCCHALEEATKQKMPEMEKWEELSATAYPDAIFLRLDGNFALTKYYSEEKQYDKVPGYANAFLNAWNDFQKRHFDPIELMFSVLRCVDRRYEAFIRAAGCEALGRLGRTAEAAELLAQEPDWEGLQPNELYSLLVSAVWSADDEKMQDLVASIAVDVKKVAGSDGTALWQSFCSAVKTAFQKQASDEGAPEHPWRVFAKVEGEIGLAAKLMEANTSEMGELLSCLDEWDDVPEQVAIRIIERGIALPDSFYHQKPGALQETAYSIAATIPDFAFHAAEQDWPAADTLVKLQFQYDLAAAALQKLAPLRETSEKERCRALCDRFLSLAQALLLRLYSEAVLHSQEDWEALLGMHQFGLWMCAAAEKKNTGDMTGYIHALRQGLRQAPVMKDMVEFLLDEVKEEMERSRVTPELQQLAERVRAILAQYPADDPAVMQLKASPAYQKVAFLIEEI